MALCKISTCGVESAQLEQGQGRQNNELVAVLHFSLSPLAPEVEVQRCPGCGGYKKKKKKEGNTKNNRTEKKRERKKRKKRREKKRNYAKKWSAKTALVS